MKVVGLVVLVVYFFFGLLIDYFGLVILKTIYTKEVSSGKGAILVVVLVGVLILVFGSVLVFFTADRAGILVYEIFNTG